MQPGKAPGGVPERRTEPLQETDPSAYERERERERTIQKDDLDLGSDSLKERLTTRQETRRWKRGPQVSSKLGYCALGATGFAQPWIAGGNTGGRNLGSSLQRGWAPLEPFGSLLSTQLGRDGERLRTRPLHFASLELEVCWAAAGAELKIWTAVLLCYSPGCSRPPMTPPNTPCSCQSSLSLACVTIIAWLILGLPPLL